MKDQFNWSVTNLELNWTELVVFLLNSQTNDPMIESKVGGVGGNFLRDPNQIAD